MTPTFSAIIRDVFIEKLSKAVLSRARGALREELSQVRPSSFPFISPDTFRSIADCVVEDGRVLVRKSLHRRLVIYCDVSSVLGTEGHYRETTEIGLARKIASEQELEPILLLGNGDFSPPAHELKKMTEFRHIFATNISQELSSVTGVPLGLENAYRHHNGPLSPFLNAREDLKLSSRSNLVFGSFAVRNNPEVRGPLAMLLGRSRFGFSQRRVSPADFRKRVSETLFVISPPGRGRDCHRTWEAIYLGAVPVVLSNSLSPRLTSNLPVLSVDRYEDFLELSDAEMEAKYWEVLSRPSSLAYMPYWVQKIEEIANNDQ